MVFWGRRGHMSVGMRFKERQGEKPRACCPYMTSICCGKLSNLFKERGAMFGGHGPSDHI